MKKPQLKNHPSKQEKASTNHPSKSAHKYSIEKKREEKASRDDLTSGEL
jgi:hypothetical protein